MSGFGAKDRAWSGGDSRGLVAEFERIVGAHLETNGSLTHF